METGLTYLKKKIPGLQVHITKGNKYVTIGTWLSAINSYRARQSINEDRATLDKLAAQLGPLNDAWRVELIHTPLQIGKEESSELYKSIRAWMNLVIQI
jgi:hypothetical protein